MKLRISPGRRHSTSECKIIIKQRTRTQIFMHHIYIHAAKRLGTGKIEEKTFVDTEKEGKLEGGCIHQHR